MQPQVMFSNVKGNARKILVIVTGLIICISACKPLRIANAPTIPDSYYKFNKSKQQVLNVLDSIISSSLVIFKEDTQEPDHILLNLKDKSDTITFVLLFKDRDLHRVESNDSSILFVMNVGRYFNRKLDEAPLYPKIGSSQKKDYLNKLESFIITPLSQQLNKSQ